MTDLPISQLADGGAAQDGDYVPIVRGSSNFKVVLGTMASENAADYVTILSAVTKDGDNDFTGANTFIDGTFILLNEADNTKQGQFDLTLLTTGVNRTYSLPNSDTTLAGLSTVNIWTANNTFSDAGFFLPNSTDATKIAKFSSSGISTATTRTYTLPNANGTLALTSNRLDAFAATTSAQFASIISDETGTGLVVLNTNASLVTPSADSLNVTGSTPAANGIYLPSANTVGISANSLRVAQFQSVASSVNYVQFTSSPTGIYPRLDWTGSDTNVYGAYVTKGAGYHFFYTGGGVTNLQLAVAHVASAVNYVQIQGSATGNNVLYTAAGSDTNIGQTFSGKGTSGQLFTNSTGIMFAITASGANAVNYLEAQGRPTGSSAIIWARGSDTNVSVLIVPQGNGTFNIGANGGNTSSLIVTQSGTVVNQLFLNAGTPTGTSPSIQWSGADLNLNAVLVAKGTGRLQCAGSNTNALSGTANVTIDASGQIAKFTSTRASKRNIVDYPREIEEILSARPRLFQYALLDNDGNFQSDAFYPGFIAEEMHDLGITDMVEYDPHGIPSGINYANGIAPLWKVCQHLYAEVQELKSKTLH